MASKGCKSYEEQVIRKPLANGNSIKWSVDMSKPMVAQVSHLGSDYDEWVHQPVKRKESPRLFENNILEFLTRCKWWMIPMIWGPVVVRCQIKALEEGLSTALLPFVFALGVIFWTFLEYILHRFLFHMKASSAITINMHYIIHGFHHKHPMDGDRLVFPPLYTAGICVILWRLIGLVLTPQWRSSFFGGALLGYIFYDLTHYFLHFGTPFSNRLYKMKKEHYDHHFKSGMQNCSFGVTSSFWDGVFGTLPAGGKDGRRLSQTSARSSNRSRSSSSPSPASVHVKEDSAVQKISGNEQHNNNNNNAAGVSCGPDGARL